MFDIQKNIRSLDFPFTFEIEPKQGNVANVNLFKKNNDLWGLGSA